jgi:hypothetical protein
MKTKLRLLENPNSLFADIACSINHHKPPPKWLVRGLEHFSGFIGQERLTSVELKQSQKILELIDRSGRALLKYLPLYEHLPWGIQTPGDVNVVLDALPRILKDLKRAQPRRSGRRKNVQREVCAAVIMECWKLIRGKAQPRSLQFQEICFTYWKACGGAEIGETNDPENWRRPAEHAAKTNNEFIRQILLMARNET